MTALDELSLLDAGLDGSQAGAKLAALWQNTFTVATTAQEAWLEDTTEKKPGPIMRIA